MNNKEEFYIKSYYFLKKMLIKLFNYHNQSKKDILILSSPRSGSTWLMEILYTQPGIKYINEPLAKNILDYNNYIPIKTRWNYITLNKHEKKILHEYFINDEIIKYFGPVNIFNSNYKLFTNRRVIKVIRANCLIEWFAHEFNFHIVYLIRHPISQALSCIKRRHHCEISEYLDDKNFVKSWLSSSQLKFVNKILNSGNQLEKYITEWCLDNIIPLNVAKNDNKIITITYEELVLNSGEILNILFRKLELENFNKMLSKIHTPSKVTDSSSNKTKIKIRSGDSDYLIKKWKDEVTLIEEKNLLSILEKFYIDAYKFDHILANKEFLYVKEVFA